MATYLELRDLADDSALKARIAVACVIGAETVRNEAPATANHPARLNWARLVLQNPQAMADQLIWATLAQNAAATPAQITGATDAAIQAAVEAAIDLVAV